MTELRAGYHRLVKQLGRFASTKGSDLMLTAAQDEFQSCQCLRHTVNAKMWRWKVVSGWRWRGQGEHINSLESRAIQFRPASVGVVNTSKNVHAVFYT